MANQILNMCWQVSNAKHNPLYTQYMMKKKHENISKNVDVYFESIDVNEITKNITYFY